MRRSSKCSFRGVNFFVLDSEVSSSQSYAVHSFPGEVNKKSVAEFIVDEPSTYPLEAFLMGDDRHYACELLKKAQQKRDPGKLVHPQLGIVYCYLRSLQAHESYTTHGKIHLRLEFIDAGVDRIAENIWDRGALALDAVQDLMAGAMQDFLEAFSVVDMPAYTLGQLGGVLDMMTGFIRSQNGLGRAASALDDIGANLGGAATSTKSLLAAPDQLAQSLLEAIGSLGLSSDIVRLAHMIANVAMTDGGASKQLTRNLVALSQLILSSIAARFALQLLKAQDNPGLSKSEAVNSLMAISAVVELALAAAPYEKSLKLNLFRAHLKHWERANADKFKDNLTLFLHEETPSLVLAYELFADLERASAFASRERRNPAALVGTVEVAK